MKFGRVVAAVAVSLSFSSVWGGREISRVGAINWDCSVPSYTFFGKAATHSLGPEKYRDRTPYYAQVVAPGKIDFRYRTLAEYEVELQHAIDAGIDYFAYCWYDLNPPEGDTSACAGKLQEITFARLNHVKSALRDRIRLCAILVTGHPYSDQALRSLALEMREPWYEKVGDRPLVFVFWKPVPIARLRKLCRQVGAGDPYVVAMIGDVAPDRPEEYEGADALSAYGCTESAKSYAELAAKSIAWHDNRRKAGYSVMPHFETGWDPSPRVERPVPWGKYDDVPWAPPATAEEWAEGARGLRRWIDANPSACPTGHVLAFAWNEFEEGGWICPNLGKDGKADVSRVKAFRRVVEILKGEPRTAGRLEYFTEDALKGADLGGVKEMIDDTLSKCEKTCREAEAFAGRLSGRDRDQVLARVELTRRLRSYIEKRHLPAERDFEILAWQGAEEMKCFFEYFRETAGFFEQKAKLPARQTVNVRDFGAKGDGVADDGPAFRAAIAAAKAKASPVRLEIPAGTYLVRPAVEPPPQEITFGLRRFVGNPGYERKSWSFAENGAGFHLVIADQEHLTIAGTGNPEVRFVDATKGGFGFFGCTGTVLKDVRISYAEKPATQGRIVRISDKPFGFVFRKDAGYPDPDTPRFLNAHSNRFTAHLENGDVKMDGTGRVGDVRRLPDGDFLFTPPDFAVNDAYWHRRKAGERVVVIARYSESAKAHPVYFRFSSFSGAEGVTVHDSPGQAFIMNKSYATHLYDCTVDRRPGSGDLVSSNADGIIAGGVTVPQGSIGPYIVGCRFFHMEDDAFNISAFAGRIGDVREDRRWITAPWFTGRFALQLDGHTGIVKALLRPSATERNTFTTAMPEDTLTQKMIGRHDEREFLRRAAWRSSSGEVRPDHVIFVPGIVGAVVRDCEARDLRGMGGQVHCSNMLIENYRVSHVPGPGLNINPLLGWGMMFDVHNVIVRNCSFRDLPTGVCVRPAAVPDGVTLRQKMIHGVHLEKVDIQDLTENGVEVDAANFWELERKDGEGRKVWNNYPESRSDIAVLRTTAFAVGIDLSARGRVEWLKSCSSGIDFAGRELRRPLFRLKFVPTENPGTRREELSSDDAATFRCETFDRRLRLVYSGFAGKACEQVVCTLSVERNDNFVYWDIDVKTSEGWRVAYSSYPDLPIAALPRNTAAPHSFLTKGRSMLFAEFRRGGRFATTAYDLAPGEQAGAALAEEIRTTRDVDGEDGPVGARRVLFLGNSINGTGPAGRWDGCWGMCASWPQKDYLHLVVRGLEKRDGRRPSWRRCNLAQWERNLATYDIRSKLASQIAFKPDLVIIALGENVANFRTAADRELFRAKLTELAQLFTSAGAKVVIRSPFWYKEGQEAIQRAVAEGVGATYVSLNGFGQDAKWQAQGSTTDDGVAWHPGDAGMRKIADRILDSLWKPAAH